MSLPEIFKNTINDNNKEEKLYRGKFTEVTDESIYDNLPVKVHIVTNKFILCHNVLHSWMLIQLSSQNKRDESLLLTFGFYSII